MFGIMPMHNANTLPVRGFCGTSVCVLSYLKGAQQTVLNASDAVLLTGFGRSKQMPQLRYKPALMRRTSSWQLRTWQAGGELLQP